MDKVFLFLFVHKKQAFLVLAMLLATPAQAADPATGRSVFRTQCAICHSAVAGRNGVGPSLAGVVGRPAGAVGGFVYSVANETAKLVWNEATLEKYLESPKTVIPGTRMIYPGLKDAARRADLIAYLATLK